MNEGEEIRDGRKRSDSSILSVTWHVKLDSTSTSSGAKNLET